MPEDYILVIDQGTTSTRAMLFDRRGRPVAAVQRELPQIYPHPGWVEHDPEEIWTATLEVCRSVSAGRSIAAIGLTNQRETIVLWERETGRPIHNAIVWQDRRTADLCARVRDAGHEPLIQQRAGLVVDPYFSASKVAWLLGASPSLRERAGRGEVLFGTVDSFLIWRLTGGRVHATDATNASRTMLFDIHRGDWQDDLLAIWDVPRTMLPEVRDSAGDFGVTAPELFGVPIPITGVAGDQQAATVGQTCLDPGMMKCTYGTGAFLLLNTGDEAVLSTNRLLATVAYQLDGRRTYASEGSIFNAGSAVQWLRDELGLIASAGETAGLAATAPDEPGVYVVPAFTGLGAPYWDAGARAAIVGLTRDAGRAHIVRATLEAVGYQTRDLLRAMAADGAPGPRELRIDGGMAGNDWLAQFLADICDLPVVRPETTETTALGASYLAGLGCGWYTSLGELAGLWSEERRFEPRIDASLREAKYEGWLEAVRKVRAIGDS